MKRFRSAELLPLVLCAAMALGALLVSVARPARSQTVQAPRLGTSNSTMPCQYNSVPPALAGGQSGQVLYEQCDGAGNVMVRVAPASGATQLLATSVAAAASQAWTSATLGAPQALTLCLVASAATTFTITASVDGTNFGQETLAGSAASANYVPAGAGSQCEAITPAPYVRVATSAAVTVTAQIAASF